MDNDATLTGETSSESPTPDIELGGLAAPNPSTIEQANKEEGDLAVPNQLTIQKENEETSEGHLEEEKENLTNKTEKDSEGKEFALFCLKFGMELCWSLIKLPFENAETIITAPIWISALILNKVIESIIIASFCVFGLVFGVLGLLYEEEKSNVRRHHKNSEGKE
ncbi:MAG TPA: hypothetical protein QKA08_05330 [Candidatus Megaira endosymbiont of Nemacystus decipiens]|nr:hypothetical protein [Candidatus Megaera endosymbiont of Nemacystus decipiens]